MAIYGSTLTDLQTGANNAAREESLANAQRLQFLVALAQNRMRGNEIGANVMMNDRRAQSEDRRTDVTAATDRLRTDNNLLLGREQIGSSEKMQDKSLASAKDLAAIKRKQDVDMFIAQQIAQAGAPSAGGINPEIFNALTKAASDQQAREDAYAADAVTKANANVESRYHWKMFSGGWDPVENEVSGNIAALGLSDRVGVTRDPSGKPVYMLKPAAPVAMEQLMARATVGQRPGLETADAPTSGDPIEFSKWLVTAMNAARGGKRVDDGPIGPQLPRIVPGVDPQPQAPASSPKLPAGTIEVVNPATGKRAAVRQSDLGFYTSPAGGGWKVASAPSAPAPIPASNPEAPWWQRAGMKLMFGTP